MALGKKGQAVAVDVMLVCICVSIFAVAIWTASMGGKAPSSQALRARQDYVKSMLLAGLFMTPDPVDQRYSAKSMSDLMVMHLMNPEEIPIGIVIAKMNEAKIGEALKEKAIGSEAEWFIFSDLSAAGSSQGRLICLHGKSGSDLIEECAPDMKVSAEVSTVASSMMVVPSGGTGGSSGVGGRFIRISIFLGIKWS